MPRTARASAGGMCYHVTVQWLGFSHGGSAWLERKPKTTGATEKRSKNVESPLFLFHKTALLLLSRLKEQVNSLNGVGDKKPPISSV